MLAGLGEEPGWRGFALPQLQERYGPLNATLLLGTVWAFWHLPVFFVDPRSAHGIADPVVLVGLVLLTALGILLYSFFYNHTGSVLLMMVLHGRFNTGTVHLVPFAGEIVFGPTYTTLLTVQVSVLFVGASRSSRSLAAASATTSRANGGGTAARGFLPPSDSATSRFVGISTDSRPDREATDREWQGSEHRKADGTSRSP